MWLVTNPASGSNGEDSNKELEACFAAAGIPVDRLIRFPAEDLPTARQLDEAGIDHIAVFAGDGTVNGLITSLYGWAGAILVLPGGTMNLLCKRLHGEMETHEILDAVTAGRVKRCRPQLVRCEAGDATAGLMAGPGTAWNDVREAMRAADIAGMASNAAHAIEQSLAAPMIRCAEPALGRREGYPLLMLTPEEDGFSTDAYHAETIGEFIAQGFALLQRDFREGPHDTLGHTTELEIESVMSEPIGLLIDGEPAVCGSKVRFSLARCEVDLLAADFDE